MLREVTRYYVNCDDCGLELPFEAPAREAERAARLAGWQKAGIEWYCPSCAATSPVCSPPRTRAAGKVAGAALVYHEHEPRDDSW